MNHCSKKLEYVVSCIEKTEYDPRLQIYAYLQFGDDSYITRSGNARDLIKFIDRSELEEYIGKDFLRTDAKFFVRLNFGLLTQCFFL